ncbi:MAG: hypothetical protein Fues2KO_54260 [Fuerstiella sp.]
MAQPKRAIVQLVQFDTGKTEEVSQVQFFVRGCSRPDGKEAQTQDAGAEDESAEQPEGRIWHGKIFGSTSGVDR